MPHAVGILCAACRRTRPAFGCTTHAAAGRLCTRRPLLLPQACEERVARARAEAAEQVRDALAERDLGKRQLLQLEVRPAGEAAGREGVGAQGGSGDQRWRWWGGVQVEARRGGRGCKAQWGPGGPGGQGFVWGVGWGGWRGGGARHSR